MEAICETKRSRERHADPLQKLAEAGLNKNRRRYYRTMLSATERELKRIRAKTRYAIRKGILKRQPCEVCGSTKVDAHHDDYTKPFAVRWLCRLHHRQHHIAIAGTDAERRAA